MGIIIPPSLESLEDLVSKCETLFLCDISLSSLTEPTAQDTGNTKVTPLELN